MAFIITTNKDKINQAFFDVFKISVIKMSEKKQHPCLHKRDAPDFIIEIQSPSTATKDLREKLDLYEKHGVKEYRVVSPTAEIEDVDGLCLNVRLKV